MIAAYPGDNNKKQLKVITFVGKSGLSLIEVVMAMAVLSIGVLSAMQMGLLATRNISSGNIVTQAEFLAQREIEKIRDYNSLADLQSKYFEDPNPHDHLIIAYQFVDPFKHVLSDTESGNCETGKHDGSGVCLVTVTVSWKRGGGWRGSRGEVQLKTLLAGSS